MIVSSNRLAILDAPHASSGLLYFAVFSRSERLLIEANQELLGALRNEDPRVWQAILERYRATQCARVLLVEQGKSSDTSGMRHQALHDLERATHAYARLTDGRRCELFRLVCQLAKYVAHDVLHEAELRNSFQEAAEINGAIACYGARWAENTVVRALKTGRNDPLPRLARRFRGQEDRG
jgi:hypothetical protein